MSARPALRPALAAALLSLVVARAVPALPGDPWTDLGQSLAGAGGAPLLTGSGTLAGGTTATLLLTNAKPFAPTLLVVGLSALNAPFKGGVMVPQLGLTLNLITSAGGAIQSSSIMPSLPSGSQFWVQYWVHDETGPAGFTASNALLGTIPQPPTPGVFPSDWIYGTCATDPPIQVHAYNEDTYILRQGKCTNFEGPFMYLFFGQDKVLMLDTGAGGIPIQATVQGIIDNWLAAHGQASIQLIVAHTHAHGDHIAGDSQFIGKPNTTVVGTSQSAVAAFFGFVNWPNDIVTYDLGGGRVLDVLAIPGHQAAHIGVYDRDTAILQTGDTLYPGFLFISGAVSQGNFAKYQASIQRLVDFTASRPVKWVLGNHVEMKSTPFQSYPYGTNFQPLEHDLQLTRQHLLELNAAVQAMGSSPHVETHADFVIQPSG
jgi:glyoxylase-like metal-dependent hydrolase (beta-lactamase superfamily II)